MLSSEYCRQSDRSSRLDGRSCGSGEETLEEANEVEAEAAMSFPGSHKKVGPKLEVRVVQTKVKEESVAFLSRHPQTHLLYCTRLLIINYSHHGRDRDYASDVRGAGLHRDGIRGN